MATVWRHLFQFRETETQSQRFQIGPHSPLGHTAEVSDVAGSLRIDFPGPDYPPERYYALIVCPDQGTQYFPVDLPCDLDIELPVLLQIFRDPEPGATTRTAAASSATGTAGRRRATTAAALWSNLTRTARPAPLPSLSTARRER